MEVVRENESKNIIRNNNRSCSIQTTIIWICIYNMKVKIVKNLLKFDDTSAHDNLSNFIHV